MTSQSTDPAAGGVPSATAPTGCVEAIHIAPSRSAPVEAVDRIRAIAGVGLEGDRYAQHAGTWSDQPATDRDITLIEAEVIEDLAARDGIVLAAGATRRNVTTRGVRLNELVGRRFRIGNVECLGMRLCEPCQHMQELVGQPVLRPLTHRAGLRATILAGGEITVGAEVVPLA